MPDMLDFIAMALQLTSEVSACEVIKQQFGTTIQLCFNTAMPCVSYIARAHSRSAYRVETGLNAAELSTRSPEVARPVAITTPDHNSRRGSIKRRRSPDPASGPPSLPDLDA